MRRACRWSPSCMTLFMVPAAAFLSAVIDPRHLNSIPVKNQSMRRTFKPENGLTLVEVLVSVAIVAILLIVGTRAILDSQFLASYSRHKIQAMYAAQWILEQQRKQTFVAASSQVSAPVVLDDGDPGRIFYGTAITTVTNLDADRNQVKVAINWPERVGSGTVTMVESYSTNLTNDPISN